MSLFGPTKSQSQVLEDDSSERQMHGRDGGPAKFCKQLRGKPLPKRRFSYCTICCFKVRATWAGLHKLEGEGDSRQNRNIDNGLTTPCNGSIPNCHDPVIEDINFSDNTNWIMINSLRWTHNLFAINPFRGSVNFQSTDALVLSPKMAVWVLWLRLRLVGHLLINQQNKEWNEWMEKHYPTPVVSGLNTVHESAPECDARLVVEAIQKWNISELQMHQPWTPLWEKHEIYFQSMMVEGTKMNEKNSSNEEIELERIPTCIIEARSSSGLLDSMTDSAAAVAEFHNVSEETECSSPHTETQL
nr:hypothetical protein CFP56_51592 [Quercus suber]